MGSRGTPHRTPGKGEGRHRGQREPAATSPAARPLTRDRSHDCPAPLTPSVHGSRSVHTPQSWSRREKTTPQRPHSVPHPRTNCLNRLTKDRRRLPRPSGVPRAPHSPATGRRARAPLRRAAGDDRQARARAEPASRARAPSQLPKKIRAPGAPWSSWDVKGRQKP